MEKYNLYEEVLNVPNLKIDCIETFDRKLEIHCHIETEKENCPHCQNPCSFVNQTTTTRLRDLSISEKEVWLILTKRQFYCEECNCYFTERINWVESNKSYTKRFSKFVFELCKNQSFQEAASIVNMCPKTVERLFYSFENKLLNIKNKWLKVRHLGIDEISNRKGKGEYCCVLTNLETGEEIDILPDRKLETISTYFTKLGTDICLQIEAISSDMWDAYATVAKKFFINAIHVIDRFHVVKSLNESMDKVRRKARKENPDNDVFKNIKWLLYKRLENCTESEITTLEAALEQDSDLLETYLLRNTFNTFFDLAPDKLWLKNQLLHWEEMIKSKGLTCFDKFLKTLKNWNKQITNFGSMRITNAATEGLNNIIRLVKRFSFGMYNFHNLRLRVLARYCE